MVMVAADKETPKSEKKQKKVDKNLHPDTTTSTKKDSPTIHYDICWTKSPEDAMIVAIQGAIETVFDPEFPLIDIWTMGLIYEIGVDEAQDIIAITMTYTTPACPSGELMQEMMTNAINEVYPAFLVTISVTFDPMWTIEMIKDEDLQRMFE